MKTKLKERKPYYLIIARKFIFWLVVLMLGIALYLLLTRENNKGRLIFTIVQLLAMLFVLRIPAFIQEIYHFKIPYLLDFVLITFAFSGFILGDVFNFYGRIPYWDSVLHAFSGVVIAYVGFIVIEYLDKEYTIPLSVSPLFMSLIVVSVALNVPPPVVVTVAVTVVTVGVIAVVFCLASALKVSSAVAVKSIL